MKTLPPPLTGFWSVYRPERIPSFPLLFSTTLQDGSVIARVVIGFTRRGTRMRAARIGTRGGYQVRQHPS